jgi:hypothetical protein
VKTICLYTELEAFSGYIKQDVKYIHRLVRDLKLTCLFYDQVIVNTPAIVEHPLTLPAFEVMSPFVRSGILWTSGQTKVAKEDPYQLVTSKADVFYEDIKSDRLILSINEVLQRWGEITPASWSLLRDANNQIADANNHVISHLSAMAVEKADIIYRDKIIDEVKRMQSDNLFSRDYLLAKIGKLKGEASISTISQMAIIVQTEYLKQGVKNIGNIKTVIFPGFFVRETKKIALLKDYLPVDKKTIPTAIKRIFKMGHSINELLNLPMPKLYLLATSKEWLLWRQYLLSDSFNLAVAKLTMPVFLKKQLIDKIKTENDKTIKPAPIGVVSEWQLIAKSLLGTTSKTVQEKSHFILNLKTRKLYLKESDKSIILNNSHLILLSVLILSGDIGLQIEQLEQFDIGHKTISSKNKKNYSKNKQGKGFNETIKNRLYVLRNRINTKIAPLNLNICIDEKKSWRLSLPENHSISLEGSVWEIQEKPNPIEEKPLKLTANTQKLYFLLKEHSPEFLSSEKISAKLFNGLTNQQKKVSDTVYRLQKQLKDSDYTIIRDYVGGYALVEDTN